MSFTKQSHNNSNVIGFSLLWITYLIRFWFHVKVDENDHNSLCILSTHSVHNAHGKCNQTLARLYYPFIYIQCSISRNFVFMQCAWIELLTDTYLFYQDNSNNNKIISFSVITLAHPPCQLNRRLLSVHIHTVCLYCDTTSLFPFGRTFSSYCREAFSLKSWFRWPGDNIYFYFQFFLCSLAFVVGFHVAVQFIWCATRFDCRNSNEIVYVGVICVCARIAPHTWKRLLQTTSTSEMYFYLRYTTLYQPSWTSTLVYTELLLCYHGLQFIAHTLTSAEKEFMLSCVCVCVCFLTRHFDSIYSFFARFFSSLCFDTHHHHHTDGSTYIEFYHTQR